MRGPSKPGAHVFVEPGFTHCIIIKKLQKMTLTFRLQNAVAACKSQYSPRVKTIRSKVILDGMIFVSRESVN